MINSPSTTFTFVPLHGTCISAPVTTRRSCHSNLKQKRIEKLNVKSQTFSILNEILLSSRKSQSGYISKRSLVDITNSSQQKQSKTRYLF